jgi:hypothetical protein
MCGHCRVCKHKNSAYSHNARRSKISDDELEARLIEKFKVAGWDR